MASGRTRQVQGWSYLEWVERLNRVLAEYEKLIWPDNIIIGGEISSAFHDYKDQIKNACDVFASIVSKWGGYCRRSFVVFIAGGCSCLML